MQYCAEYIDFVQQGTKGISSGNILQIFDYDLKKVYCVSRRTTMLQIVLRAISYKKVAQKVRFPV